VETVARLNSELIGIVLLSLRVSLPAGDAHVTSCRGVATDALDQEIMALGLPQNRRADRRFQEIVGFGATQRRAQIGRVVLTQAHIERSRAGDADAIAALAEIMRERRDEAEPTASFGYVEIARGDHRWCRARGRA
jgi:hypothetical protein